MILVKTYLDKSKIVGIGLFAKEDIKAGTPIWEYKEGFDQAFDQKDLDSMSEASKEQIINYAYPSRKNNILILCFDDSRFFNHSKDYNVNCPYSENSVGEEDLCYARRDIKAGEELTCNYKEFYNYMPDDMKNF